MCGGCDISPAPRSIFFCPNTKRFSNFPRLDFIVCVYLCIFVHRYCPRSWPSRINIWILRHQVIQKKRQATFCMSHKGPFPSKAFLLRNFTYNWSLLVRDTAIWKEDGEPRDGFGACMIVTMYVCRMGTWCDCANANMKSLPFFLFFLPASEGGCIRMYNTLSETLLFRGSPFLLSHSFWWWLYIYNNALSEWIFKPLKQNRLGPKKGKKLSIYIF